MAEFAIAVTPSPGSMAVNFEERVNFQRLREYRLARVRQALDDSPAGALLCFDTNNIRYTTSTQIGEWARDKMTRYSLLARESEPWCGTSVLRRRIIACTLHGSIPRTAEPD